MTLLQLRDGLIQKRIKEIERTGCFTAKRKGVVGRKLLYNKKESEKLMDRLEMPRMTQVKLAREEGVDRRTIRRATRYDPELNPDGCFPYAPRDTPALTPRIQEQRLKFVNKSPRSEAHWNKVKQLFGFIDHSPSSMSGQVNRKHDPNWKRKSTKRKKRVGTSSQRKENGSQASMFYCNFLEYISKFHHLYLPQK